MAFSRYYRTLILAAIVVGTTAPSTAQVFKGIVFLQPTTPGVAQLGSINISGTMKLGQLHMPTGAVNGYTLRSNSLGMGTWAPDGLSLPFLGINSGGGDAFRIEATGTAITGISDEFAFIGRNSISNNFVEMAGQGKALAAFHGVTGVSAHLAQEFDAVFGHNALSGNFGYLGTRWEGVLGVTPNSNQAGVFGSADPTSGFAIGVFGNTNSPDGEAVAGNNSSRGTQGQIGTRYDGVAGRNYGSSGSGVYGFAHDSGTQNFGLFGRTDSPQGYGAYAFNNASGSYGSLGGPSIGVYGNTETDGSAGVYGYARGYQAKGVVGGSERGNFGSLGAHYDGVTGVTVVPSGAGIYGQTNYGGSGTFGVYGRDVAGAGYGVFSDGNLGSSGLKSFMIDHPLDPTRSYLLHYCSEGPVPQNTYNGNVRSDANGEAWVDLPEYFDAINVDPKYQLTVIDSGEDFVVAKVARKIENNRFLIRTSRPGIEVSWEVTAARNDRYVRRHGAPAEVEKPTSEQGTYLRPELFGQPDSARSVSRLTSHGDAVISDSLRIQDVRDSQRRTYPKARR